MYVQITTACNMSCSHCCYCCFENNPNAYHMNIPTWANTLKFWDSLNHLMADGSCGDEHGFDNMCTTLCIGGGEPTMHPQFWQFLGMALEARVRDDFDAQVWMKTNGKLHDRAKAVLQLGAQNGNVFACDLSADQFHEEIKKDMYAYAGESKWRDIPRDRVADCGFARDNGESGIGEHSHSHHKSSAAGAGLPYPAQCVCEDVFVNPDGDIFMCGCDGMYFPKDFNGESISDWVDTPKLGNVNNRNDVRDFLELLSKYGHTCIRNHNYAEALLKYSNARANITTK